VDMGVEPFLVAASVRCFLAQRLVRRLCQKCKQPGRVTTAELRSVGFRNPGDHATYTAKPRGCDNCNHSGYYGRLAIYEVCVVTKEIEDLIVKRAPESALKEMAARQGFIPMREYGIFKVFEGETTMEEVISATATDMTLGAPD